MRILVTGATGLVGSALVQRLIAGGHDVVTLSTSGRSPAPAPDTESSASRTISTLRWDPESGAFDTAALGGCDAVVHLAGENVAGGRWTPARMHRIRDSRERGTRRLVEQLATLPTPPRVWVGASATGIYGDRGDEVLNESSTGGEGFLAEVCRAWEAASEPVAGFGCRRALLRVGIVLDPRGGALAKMLPFFRLGLGGVLGSGRQWMSWVSLGDLCGMFERALQDDAWSGPLNAVTPTPVTNREFTKALGRALGRPAILPAPGFGLRLLYGRMADALLLSSQRVHPTRLLEHGFSFADTDLDATLARLVRSS
ncbi:MAG: TIGR01777 family protein [Planctomycetes bacterium]|nr:TIGR01777 family protein [Planctomycetota bacterium]